MAVSGFCERLAAHVKEGYRGMTVDMSDPEIATPVMEAVAFGFAVPAGKCEEGHAFEPTMRGYFLGLGDHLLHCTNHEMFDIV